MQIATAEMEQECIIKIWLQAMEIAFSCSLQETDQLQLIQTIKDASL